jgi:predicted Zn finger-like uncharacterized protein
MKFLCDQCKAKYQIADEKVQGKTLRMKCRKCGHVIEIRALTGDTKHSTVPPSSGALSSQQTMQLDSLSDEAAAAALSNPSIPQAPKNPFARAPAAGTPANKAAPPRPGGGIASPPRPGGLGGGLGGRADATGARSPLAGSPTGTRPIGRPEAPKKTAVTTPPEDDNGPPSALANAFNRSVTRKPELTNPSSSASTDPPAEEWYVAIEEVPVGPIRLTDLRAKYGEGNVTDDSLVWREGFEEWRPLRTLAELHELVREEVSQPRGSIMPGSPSKAGAQRSGHVGHTPRPSAVGGRGTTPSPSAGGRAGSATSGNVIPFQRQQGVAARKLEEDEDEVTRISSAPFFPPAPAAKAEPTGAAAAIARAGIAGTEPRIVDDPFASGPIHPSPVPITSPTGQSPASAAVIARPASNHPPDFGTTQERHSVMARLSGRVQGISKGFVALIAAAALLLGVVIAVVLVKRMTVVQERIVEKQVEVPVSVFVPVPGGPTAPTVASAEPSASTTSTKVAIKGTGAPATTGSAAPTATGTGKKWGLGDEPAIPTDNPTVAPQNQGALDGKAVGEVAQRNSVGVRKVCYEKLVETGPADAKVNVHIRPDGTVSQVDLMSGSPSTFAACVQKLAYNWKFPTSGSGGTYPIPFIFK